ncbi:hypothetical protein KNP414_04501 [Paenibacillus mucilaginosus KNP414]|uniref:Uncharacterized protein n=1 Tax=Paenibacillus mucilaginosus (strain KNP414) TaxID=1036673 RepID=F8F9A3_PAEMK|nr:hypothetical protein KNP414_04501 [Paenibacillus mucilaginosus KNP414]
MDGQFVALRQQVKFFDKGTVQIRMLGLERNERSLIVSEDTSVRAV